MGAISSLFLGGRRSIEDPTVPLSSIFDNEHPYYSALTGGITSSSGINVSRDVALTYAAVWRAVTLISRDVAKLPFNVYRRTPDGRGKDVDREHAAHRLLRRKPNKWQTAFVFRQTLTGHVLLDGNGYAKIVRNGSGVPRELIPLPPDRVELVSDSEGTLYKYHGNAGDVIIQGPNMLHIKGMGFDGVRGYSVVAYARDSFGRGLAAGEFASFYFKNSGRPATVLTHPATMDEQVRKRLKLEWESMYKGVENAHRTALLQEGMDVKPLSLSAEDAQLLESRQFEVRDIANWFGVPPHKLGDSSRTSYNSLEQENQAYLNEALDGWLCHWEQECNDKLLTESERDRDTHFCEFNRNALVSADLASRTKSQIDRVQWGLLTRNEARAQENLNPLDGGDDPVLPLNVGTVDDEPEPGNAPEPEDDTRADVLEAHREMLADGLRRMAKRLGIHARKAAREPDGYIDWLDTGMDDHRRVVRATLAPLVAASCSIAGGNPGVVLERMVDQFFGDLRHILLTASECQPADLARQVAASMEDFERSAEVYADEVIRRRNEYEPAGGG